MENSFNRSCSRSQRIICPSTFLFELQIVWWINTASIQTRFSVVWEHKGGKTWVVCNSLYLYTTGQKVPVKTNTGRCLVFSITCLQWTLDCVILVVGGHICPAGGCTNEPVYHTPFWQRQSLNTCCQIRSCVCSAGKQLEIWWHAHSCFYSFNHSFSHVFIVFFVLHLSSKIIG